MKNIIPDSTEKTLIKTVLKPQRDLTKERRFKRAYDTIARYSKDNHLKVLELLAIVVGLTFTIQAIERNTESNRVASREQLYASENIIGGREYADANTKLLSLYAKPSANVKDPKEYCRQLVEVVTTDPAILAFLEDKNPPTKQRAEIFYDIIFGLQSFKNRGDHMVEFRRMYAHCTTILAQLHAAFDFMQEGVITEEEFKTWRGYFTDIGPNPVFLVTIMTWRDQHYISRRFGELIQQELTSDPMAAKVVDYFYPLLRTPAFLDGLPRYPEKPTIRKR